MLSWKREAACTLLMACALMGLTRAAEEKGANGSEELQMLGKRVEGLETRSRHDAAEGNEGQSMLRELQKTLGERLGTLSIHGGVVGYYQAAAFERIDGTKIGDPSGLGFVADLKLTFELFAKGRFYLRTHAGEGDGADRGVEGALPDDGDALFADLNTINDDNPDGAAFDLLEACYAQEFFDGRLLVVLGKTEPEVFIDGNEFANNEACQFLGKPFVNDPVLDSEDEFGPLFAVGVQPWEEVKFTFVYHSCSHPLLEESRRKSVYDDIFDSPVLAGQMAYSLALGELSGTYRLYGWTQAYDHPELKRPEKTDEGWGIGLSCDQQVAANVGVFGRVGYHDENVYEVPWFWSMGVSLTGVIPSRVDDVLGIAGAALMANDDLPEDDMEYHIEMYYRISVLEHLAITPGFHYVIHPRGDTHNDDVFAGMVRAEISF